MMATGVKGEALEVGVLTPKMSPRASLSQGEIGYIVTNLKSTREAKVGDTVTVMVESLALVILNKGELVRQSVGSLPKAKLESFLKG